MAKGITNETRSTSQKKFKPDPAKWHGLCIGALVDVHVTDAEIKEDSGMSSFQGKTIPRLNFIFESRLDPKGVKKSVYVHSYLAQEHTPESVTEDGDWRWRQLISTVKHLLDVYRDEKPFTSDEEKLMVVDFEDVNEDGVYLPQEADVIIDAFRKFFDNIVIMFKPDGKAIYKTPDGKDILVWMKLLLDIKGAKVNNGDYGFPGFPGEGLIEKYVDGVPPSLSINISKAENIIPKAPTPAGTPPPTSGQGNSQVSEENIPAFMRGGN